MTAAPARSGANRRDMDATFGAITVGPEDFPTVYISPAEADLRRSLASVAYAYGWDVREEVVIPGWGRIDIVLDAPGETYLIELKVDLTKPARIRRAFQQADGYGRWWTNNIGRAADVILVGAKMDDPAVSAVADAYYTVVPRSVGSLIYFLENGGHAKDARALRARGRASRAAFVATFHQIAADRLAAANLVEAPTSEVTA